MRFVSFTTVNGTKVFVDKNKVNAVLDLGEQTHPDGTKNVVVIYVDGDSGGYNVVNPLGEIMDYLEDE